MTRDIRQLHARSGRFVATVLMCAAMPCAAAEAAADEADKWLTIVPKYFEPTKDEPRGGLGFSYKIDKTLSTPAAKQDLSANAFHLLDLDLKAEGNVAFNSRRNPSDFLKSGLELNYRYQHSSVPRLGGPGSKCDPKDPATVKECIREAQASKDADAIGLFAGFVGSLESDQRFDKRNATYGGHITIVYRPAPDAFINQSNILDWPFRLTRGVSGHPLGFKPSPDAFPKLRLAVERVKPKKDPDRQAVLGTLDEYDRGNVEVALTSPVATIKGRQVKFEGSWRYFKELEADPAIKRAGLDRFRYAAMTLRLDAGWQVTYASGKLPLDRESDKVWELGYHIDFP
jgi:hypothetical protein